MMARYRTIKPEFWTSAQIVECSTNARLLFIGLWNFSDDFGRHAFSPKQIKAEIFPADDFSSENIRGMLDELSSNGLISVYTAENKEILQVTGWHHQRIDRPQKAKFPGPFDDGSSNGRRAFDPEEKGIEEKRKERKNSVRKIGLNVFSGKTEIEKEEFEQFWTAYGSKLQRKDAEKSFVRARATVSLEQLLAGVETYHRTRPEWQHIALAATWLNGERWNDQPAPINGHATATETLANPMTIFIKSGTDQWNAWEEFYRKSKGTTPPKSYRTCPEGGWHFPSEWPPTTLDG